MDVKVSVLMPAYNAAAFIGDAIESVLGQQFESYELIVFDDCSTDETADILAKYSVYPNIRVHRPDSRVGETVSRNVLIDISRAEYLSLCDADDIILPLNLKRFSTILDEDPKIGIVNGGYLIVESSETGALRTMYVKEAIDPDGAWDILSNIVFNGGSMLRKSNVVQVGGYDPTYKYVCDNDLWFKMAEVSKIRCLPGEVHYVYRKHASAITRSQEYTEARTEEYQRLLREVLQRRYGTCNF